MSAQKTPWITQRSESDSFSFAALLFLRLKGLWLLCACARVAGGFLLRATPTLGAFASVGKHAACACWKCGLGQARRTLGNTHKILRH